MHKYRLVLFINNKKKKDIDIVPASWICYNEKNSTLMCKFPKQPFDEEKGKLLRKMLEDCDEPEKDWLSYRVELRGRAFTLQEAEEKATLLESQAYAYSTDSQTSARKKSENDKKSYKLKAIPQTENMPTISDIKSFKIDWNNEATKKSDGNKDDREKRPKKQFSQKSIYNRSATSSDSEKSIGRKSQWQKKSFQKSTHDVSAASSDLEKSSGSSTATEMSCALKTRTKSSKNKNDNVAPKISANTNSRDKLTRNEFDKSQRKVETSHWLSLQPSSTSNFSDKNSKVSDCTKDWGDEHYNSLNYKMGELLSRIIDMQGSIQQLQSHLERLEIPRVVEPHLDEAEDLNIFPCESFAEFAQFDEKLSNDRVFYSRISELVRSLSSQKSSVSRNVGKIIRQFLTRELAMTFTTVKKMPGRYIFVDTTLYRCIKEVLSTKFKERDGSALENQSIIESVRAVLNNAKDWDGQGSARKKNGRDA